MGLQASVSPYSTPDVLAIASAFSMEKSLIVSCCSHKAHHENSFMIFLGEAEHRKTSQRAKPELTLCGKMNKNCILYYHNLFRKIGKMEQKKLPLFRTNMSNLNAALIALK